MTGKKDRLKEIQLQLDVLMDEVRRLRDNIGIESRRRTYPFPFEPGVADEKASGELPVTKRESH